MNDACTILFSPFLCMDAIILVIRNFLSCAISSVSSPIILLLQLFFGWHLHCLPETSSCRYFAQMWVFSLPRHCPNYFSRRLFSMKVYAGLMCASFLVLSFLIEFTYVFLPYDTTMSVVFNMETWYYDVQTSKYMIVKLTYFRAEFETEWDISTCFYRSWSPIGGGLRLDPDTGGMISL